MMSFIAKLISYLSLLIIFSTGVNLAQRLDDGTQDFRSVVEKRLKRSGVSLNSICPIDTDRSARRIFAEYGAVFLSNYGGVPSHCIFANEAEAAAFQSRSISETVNIGGTSITLQKTAMADLIAARKEAVARGLNITPRGGAIAAKRTFAETVTLWNSRFLPALNYWAGKGKISRKDAENARRAAVPEQVARVLEWEQDGLYFSKDFSKSILYSVAAPGASQHIFMLALDVEQFSNRDVRKILGDHGWFQTVKSDLPHFTYLGVKEGELPSLGLKPVQIGGQTFWIPNLD